MIFLEFVSALFGWVYTICWSLSFYPQPIHNFKRKSTAGTTVDFPFINVLGSSASSRPVDPAGLVQFIN
jgi:cystinosin